MEQAPRLKRLILTTGHRCPARCIYCFALQPGYEPPPRLAEYAPNFGDGIQDGVVLQPACDTDLLAEPQAAIHMLSDLAERTNFISFSTKLEVTARLAVALREIDLKLRDRGGRMSVTVSIPRTWSLAKLERGTASPEVRYENLRVLESENIHTVTAIRPVLADLSREEIAEIVNKTSLFCSDYTDGPLYLKTLGRFARDGYSVKKGRVPWLPHDPSLWFILDAAENREIVRAEVISAGCRFWDSNAEAVLGYPNTQ